MSEHKAVCKKCGQKLYLVSEHNCEPAPTSEVRPKEWTCRLDTLIINNMDGRFPDLPTPSPLIHVIEHSAYLAVVKERDELRASERLTRDLLLVPYNQACKERDEWKDLAGQRLRESLELAAQLAELQAKYSDRAASMRETGDQVRSLYTPKVQRLERALALALYYVEGDATYEALKEKTDKILRGEE